VLVRAFLDAAAQALRFLASEPGFNWETSVVQMTNRGLEPVAPEAITSFFWARGVFATERIAGEVTYGDREAYINLTVSRAAEAPPRLGQFGLWEWCAALGGVDDRASGEQFVLTAGRVREVVTGLAAVLREYAPRIAAAGPDVVARIEAARVRRQAEWDEEQRRDQHRTTAARAAKAFRAGDYQQVVALLEPLGERLTPAERKKLDLARERR
jgi:hypothetical protein